MFLRVLLTACLMQATVALAAPIGSSFTYQGELQDNGAPASGTYDLQAELFDAASGGTMVGGPIIAEDVIVNDGVFSVELDFGASPFLGDLVWLEIGVRDGASGGGFTGLLPRQKITPAPYAQLADRVPQDAISDFEIQDNSVGSDDIANVTRTLVFDANGMGSGPPEASDGLVFSNTFNGLTCCTNLVIKRPRDWDGVSSITVELFTRGSTTGTDRFFIRPRDYNDGDPVLDTAGVPSGTRNFTANLQFRVFTVTLSAASLPKEWWYLVIQRDTTGGTNTGDIRLLSVAVSYTAVR